jgi:hypothetical protein
MFKREFKGASDMPHRNSASSKRGSLSQERLRFRSGKFAGEGRLQIVAPL